MARLPAVRRQGRRPLRGVLRQHRLAVRHLRVRLPAVPLPVVRLLVVRHLAVRHPVVPHLEVRLHLDKTNRRDAICITAVLFTFTGPL